MSEFNQNKIIDETERCLLVIDPLDGLYYIYIVKKSDGTQIGQCSLAVEQEDDTIIISNLGYSLFDDQEKKHGYMGEVIPKLLEYLFIIEEVALIQAYTWPSNIPSLKILNRNFIICSKTKSYLNFELSREEYICLQRNK